MRRASISSTALVSYRIENSIHTLLRELAEERGVTESVLVEQLVVEEGQRSGMIKESDPRAAFQKLLGEIEGYLDSRRGRHDRAITLDVFNMIKDSTSLAKLHREALEPPSAGITSEQRRQFVHQRIGRYVKEYLGLESGREVVLPRGSEALIRSYTELV